MKALGFQCDAPEGSCPPGAVDWLPSVSTEDHKIEIRLSRHTACLPGFKTLSLADEKLGFLALSWRPVSS